MKIGDEVRFLSETGGGKVVGFRDKNVVLVKDADGFEIPMPVSEVVVVQSDSYDRNFKKLKPEANATSGQKPQLQESTSSDKQAAPRRFVAERREGEKLNVLLAFVPTNPDDMVATTFDTYIVNDSNYFLTLAYLSAEGTAWTARFEGTLEPNTKFFVEEVRREELDKIARVALQMIAYKREKPFALKPAISVELRVDGSKFYKAGAFKPNEFFSEPALIVEAVRNDVPAREIFADAGRIREALLVKNTPSHEVKPTQGRKHTGDTIEVDLHGSALFDSTDGLEAADILNRQLAEVRNVMEQNKRHKGQRIVFIHGKGDGVLRAAVLKELKRHYPSCRTQDASFLEYGFGATLVVVG